MTFSEMVRRDLEGDSSSFKTVPSESPLGKLQQLSTSSATGMSAKDEQLYKMILDPKEFRKQFKKPKEVFMPPSYLVDPKKAKSSKKSN
jgi:hypothetical protein